MAAGVLVGAGFLAFATPAGAQIIDDFNRSDSSSVGSGWVEKSADVFGLNALAVQKAAVSTGYRDNIVYRQSSENLLNVEAAVEIRLTDLSPFFYPQLFARVQTATVQNADTIDAYILYLPNSTSTAIVGRQLGGNFVEEIGSINISPALNTTDTYRLRLRVEGTSPVELDGYVERFANNTWTIIGQASLQDWSAQRIQTAGSVGVGGTHQDAGYRYDNFARYDLSGLTNPPAVLTGLNPTSAAAGSGAFTLSVTGSNFVDGAIVRWNGSNRTTTFVSATQLTAQIQAADVTTVGAYPVTVLNPAPGGGLSSAVNFNVTSGSQNNPVPVLSSITPSSTAEGGSGFMLTAAGSGFVQGSQVRWNGTARTTAFISSTQLTAVITAADVATDGTATVTVFSPSPGGGTSAGRTFTITNVPNNPVPTITSLSPTSRTEDTGTFTLTVNGTNLVASSVVRWDGADLSTTFVSSTRVTATVPGTSITEPGTVPVSVFSPTPGGGTSNTANFSITATPPPPNPDPELWEVYPQELPVGAHDPILTVWGSGFTDTTQIRWNGQARTTYFHSEAEVSVRLTSTDLSSPTTATLSAFNPSPGGGTSGSVDFEVTTAPPGAAVPVTHGLSPYSWPRNGGATTVTVSGANFTPSSVVRFNNSPRTTTYVNSTTLIVALPATDVSVGRVATITVVTPNPGGGTSQPQTFFVLEPNSSVFYDSFNRADDVSIGNDWTEKSPSAFQLVNRQILSRDTTFDYRDALVYRPPAEDLRDVEVAVEFQRRTLSPANFPQLHARVQRDTITQAATEAGYIFFISESGGEASISVQNDQPASQVECFIRTVQLATPLQFGQRYRLRFRVSGALPVQLTGTIEHFTNGVWTVLGSGNATHDFSTQANPNLFCGPGSMPPPVMDSGATAFSKYYYRTDTYDNFYALDIDTGLNPVPGVTTLSPGSAVAASGAFNLTVLGGGFMSSSVVRWNGGSRPTTFVSAGELRAAISATDIAAVGSAQITVFNPSPGGGTSSAVTFPITAGNGDPTVFDDFERTDSAVIGNGWIEKNPGAFSLVGGFAVKNAVGTAYRDNVVYRPASENLVDVEASVEMRLVNATPGYPQLFARLQTDTAATPNVLDGYMLYVNNSTSQAILGRQRADNFVEALATFAIAPSLNTTDIYRLRIRATGTSPVQLLGVVERQSGGGWTIVGQASATDNTPQRITAAGSVGFGGYIEDYYRFNNFDYEDLSP